MEKEEYEYRLNIPWYKRLWSYISPTTLYNRYIRRQKYADREFDDVMSVFDDKRIDIIPELDDGRRSFKLILNKKRALIFVQYEDHFIFEGDEYSASEYPNLGMVTIFDHIDVSTD